MEVIFHHSLQDPVATRSLIHEAIVASPDGRGFTTGILKDLRFGIQAQLLSEVVKRYYARKQEHSQTKNTIEKYPSTQRVDDAFILQARMLLREQCVLLTDEMEALRQEIAEAPTGSYLAVLGAQIQNARMIYKYGYEHNLVSTYSPWEVFEAGIVEYHEVMNQVLYAILPFRDNASSEVVSVGEYVERIEATRIPMMFAKHTTEVGLKHAKSYFSQMPLDMRWRRTEINYSQRHPIIDHKVIRRHSHVKENEQINGCISLEPNKDFGGLHGYELRSLIVDLQQTIQERLVK